MNSPWKNDDCRKNLDWQTKAKDEVTATPDDDRDQQSLGRTGKKGDFSIGDDNVITRGGIYTYASCQIIKSQIVRDFSQTVFSLNAIWDDMIYHKRAKAVIYPDPWIDIGTKQAFEQAKQKFHGS